MMAQEMLDTPEVGGPQDTDAQIVHASAALRGKAVASARAFDYEQAFARNLGWVTGAEQTRLRQCRVAIAGMGGVGGEHLLTLARLGIGRFRIADFDHFDLPNMNRQAGAAVSTLGCAKARVLAEMARDIHPALDLDVWERPVEPDNVDAFLADVDVYVDGLDFFAFTARASTFAACERLAVPAVTAAPLGMGAALLNFLPGGMGFERYFGWAGCNDDERSLRFLIGLAPRLLQDYLADPSRLDLTGRAGPSTPMAIKLCAGIAATELLKIVLGRGVVRAAPHGLQFDAYRQRLVQTWRPGGHRNPLTLLTLAIARRRLAAMRQAAQP
jgi:molybdopterin-synthase adenylyltransferase